MTGGLESFYPKHVVCPLALLYILCWQFCQNHEFASNFHNFCICLRLASLFLQVPFVASVFLQVPFVDSEEDAIDAFPSSDWISLTLRSFATNLYYICVGVIK